MTSELAPGFLVAAPSLLDPNFKRTVVLLVEHRPEGSLGFVINRPAEVRMRAMLERLGLKVGDAKAEGAVLLGGPMLPQTGWVLFEDGERKTPTEEVVRISPRLVVSASRELLEEVAFRPGSERMMLILGYAGWGPNQLDQEIAQGAWIPVDFDEKIVIETPFQDRWGQALKSLGIDPARLSPQPPSES
jgi:putative transcriptional regulator